MLQPASRLWIRSLATPATRDDDDPGNPLEAELERKLNQTRIVHGLRYHGKIGRVDILHSPNRTSPRYSELWMIENVKELCSELQSHALPPRQGKVLDCREIGIHEPGTKE